MVNNMLIFIGFIFSILIALVAATLARDDGDALYQRFSRDPKIFFKLLFTTSELLGMVVCFAIATYFIHLAVYSGPFIIDISMRPGFTW